MYSLISVLLLNFPLYTLKRRKAHQFDEPYIMKKNIIKLYNNYYIALTLHKIKTIIKLYLNSY